jgi:Tfp pilus assembly protein PilO
VTARDRIIIAVVLVVAALAGFWFLAIAPKRKDATALQAKIDVASQQLAQAEQSAAQARHAKERYDVDYGEVATLGKAVPKNDALPSLLYQLQSAAHNARVNFTSLKVTSTGAPASTPAAATASVAQSANPSAATAANPAAATQAATATLPPGAVVGSAGFPTMPFSFVFDGSFPDMQSFLRDVQRFVRVKGDKVDVSGRLLSVDAFSLIPGPNGFPSVRANISATAYLLAPGDNTSSAAAPTGSNSPTTTPPATSSQVAR